MLDHINSLAGRKRRMAENEKSRKIFHYGSQQSQYLHISIPPGELRNAPVAFLVHGGFWKQKWTVDNTCMASITPDLVADGFAVAEVEYRRREDDGGGWPGSNEDVLAALNYLPTLAAENEFPLDLSRVVLIGHSAGGTLVLWVAAHADKVLPALVVAVAPIADLEAGFYQRCSSPPPLPPMSSTEGTISLNALWASRTYRAHHRRAPRPPHCSSSAARALSPPSPLQA